MIPIADGFEFEYAGSRLVYGRGAAADLEDHLRDLGYDRAMVVCGRNVGSNEPLMTMVRDGLGDALVSVFDETTPEKLAETVGDGMDAMAAADPDVLVGLGGGSSLDLARCLSAYAADGRPISAYREAALDGREAPPDPDPTDLTAVAQLPTTFAGAAIGTGGSAEILSADESPTGQPIQWNYPVMPELMCYDPALYDTTPAGALAGSAMNGFDKPLETIYSRHAHPLTDATAVHALRLLGAGFRNLDGSPEAMDRAVAGMVLAEFERNTNVVHAFGHGLARRYPVQQGKVHAIVVPHVLRYVFGKVDGNRALHAAGLGIDAGTRSDDELAEAIVAEVTAVRDNFDLPTRLRELDPVDPDDFPAIAEFVVDDYAMADAPAALDPTAAELEAVLQDAW